MTVAVSPWLGCADLFGLVKFLLSPFLALAQSGFAFELGRSRTPDLFFKVLDVVLGDRFVSVRCFWAGDPCWER